MVLIDLIEVVWASDIYSCPLDPPEVSQIGCTRHSELLTSDTIALNCSFKLKMSSRHLPHELMDGDGASAITIIGYYFYVRDGLSETRGELSALFGRQNIRRILYDMTLRFWPRTF